MNAALAFIVLEERSDKIIRRLVHNFLKKILENFEKVSDSISNKIEVLIDFLEDKINYPEKNELKNRCDFSNIKNELEKLIEICFQILLYLTLFASFCIFIGH